MSAQSAPEAQSIEKKSVAGVTFDGTADGKLDESAIPSDSYKSHYLYPRGTKSDSSFPVVDASGDLRRGNVSSAWDLRGHAPDGSDIESKLRKLGAEFDSNPIPSESENESSKQAFEKHAEIAKIDADRQIAVGVAMVPNSVDEQGDFERPETIQRLSEGYMERLAAGDAQNGVMHARFPGSDTMSHVENRVLDAPEKIGDEEYPAGTWAVSKRIKDDDLWRLVDADILSGFSIGGYVHDGAEYAGDDIPDDITVPDAMREASEGVGFPIREITDASVHEISLVDIPAVPEAQIQTAKGDGLLKAAPELTAGVEPATDHLVNEMGRDEQDAREIAEFLNREDKSATADDAASWIARAKRYFSRDENHDADGERAEKGQVLSAENITRTMAIHDITLSLLGTELDHGRTAFAEDSSFDFSGVAFTQPEDSGGEGTVFSAAQAQQPAEPAEPGATRTETKTLKNMSDDDTHDVIERLESLEAEFEEDGPEQTEMEIGDGETKAAVTVEGAELSDEQRTAIENALSDGGGGTPRSELESKVEEQAETQQRMLEVLERMASAQGVSQQADVSTGGNEQEETWSRSPFAVGGGSQ